jgi:hypothetical protein
MQRLLLREPLLHFALDVSVHGEECGAGYGRHLVFVDSIIPGRIPDFEEVDVKTAWLVDQKDQDLVPRDRRALGAPVPGYAVGTEGAFWPLQRLVVLVAVR